MPTINTRVRDRLIDDAIRLGKFTERRRPHYERLYAADPRGTTEMILTLAAIPDLDAIEAELSGRGGQPATMYESTLPARPAAGGGYVRAATPAPPQADTEADYDLAWLTAAERGRVRAAEEGRQHARVVNEAT